MLSGPQLSDKAILAVVPGALKEAKRLGCDYVGCVHVLLALLRMRRSLAVKVLVGLGINVPKLRQKGEGFGTSADRWRGRPHFLPEVRETMAYALNEAAGLGTSRIGPEHVLLGLLRHENTARWLLADEGLDLVTVGAAVQRLARSRRRSS